MPPQRQPEREAETQLSKVLLWQYPGWGKLELKKWEKLTWMRIWI
jgi:hypothetical protein